MFEKHFGCTRLVWNLALEVRIEAYRLGFNLTAFDLCYQLPDLKAAYPFLKEVDSQALLASIIKMDKAYKNFFRGAGFPKFKSKHQTMSFQCPHNTRKVDWDKGMLSLPKMKDIPIVLSRKFNGTIKTVTVSKTSTGKYFAAILVDTGMEVPKKPDIVAKTTIGIDLGLKHYLITSEGVKVDNPKHLQNSMQRLKVLQRRVSRKKRGSSNRRKANHRVAILHERIKNKRGDFLHKLTTSLVRDNQADTFVLEDLSSRNMMANHKLAQAIASASWAEFRRQLRYKCDWYGKNLIVINRFEPTSKKCSNCGDINSELTLAVREWQCVKCSVTHDRDINAAKNIKFVGLSGADSSEEPVERRLVGRARKQERVHLSI